ncbi:protein adenylyltransferase SelO [Undibacterium fentianense]|uniref:Protein nucleotidyltransferase YdiU n=1 Tax=Undibacterium fentianense TaxID=2828728 RepID=A0A941E0Z1_9BURK|nr:YdiU family protein [Undibacterium fentianense]MBR7798659.1 YdiU family protein [Undibacterium fentianense]
MTQFAINSSSALNFENRYASLSKNFFTPLDPTPLKNPYLITRNVDLLQNLGLAPELLDQQEILEVFSGNRVHQSSRPIATVYSGHQFGIWAGQLGDGRAILLGELKLQHSQESLEIQLKGAGVTPYSRMGDGRAVLRSSIREYLCSEAMAALGIPSSRALCLIGSDQYTMREMPEKTAVVTRAATSFIRFGNFEHWYYNQASSELKELADFVIFNYYPELHERDNPYLGLLEEVIKRTATLIAHWQCVGFMHGVLNTDNMSILGITLDYGPFGFMDGFNPSHICNHSDTQGRYAYHMQPEIGHWNCHALAQAMLPLIGDIEQTQSALSNYITDFKTAYHANMLKKIGLYEETEDDQTLYESYLEIMANGLTDFTLAFRRLSQISKHNEDQDQQLRDLFIDRSGLDAWLRQYRQRLQRETLSDEERRIRMNLINPKFVLRNHLAQQAIQKAENKDYTELHTLSQVLKRPFDEQSEFEAYAQLPPDWASEVSVSCSS